MLEDYTITEYSDNRIRHLPICKPDEIIIGSTCTHVFILPFIYHEQAIRSEIIYRQGLSIILIKPDTEFEITENEKRKTSTITLKLNPEDTILFEKNLLDTFVQIKILNKDEEILYNIPNEIIIRKPLDIFEVENLGIKQENDT